MAAAGILFRRHFREDDARGDGLPAAGYPILEFLLVVGLDAGAVVGDPQQGHRFGIALFGRGRRLGDDLLDHAHHILVAGLLAQQPTVKTKLVGVLVVAILHVADVDRQAAVVVVHVVRVLRPVGLALFPWWLHR